MAWREKPTVEYLRDLAERLMHVPVMFGVDQYDVDRLSRIAREIEQPKKKKRKTETG